MDDFKNFADKVKERGIGFIYGLVQGEKESDEDFQKRIDMVRGFHGHDKVFDNYE